MARRDIHNELDRKNRNNHNDNYKELYRLKKTVNDLVLDSGESDAEVVQARAGEETLNDRLDIMEDKTENVSKDMEELEEDLTKETEDRLQATLDEVEDTVQDIIEANEFKGAMVVMAKNKNVKHEKWTMCQWDKAVYNLSGFWSSDNNTRFVIPKGVKKVKVSCSTLWPSNGEGSRRVRARKNGSYTTGLFYNSQKALGTSPTGASSGVIDVSEGDYIEMEVFQASGDDLELREDPYTWFAIEVVEFSKK